MNNGGGREEGRRRQHQPNLGAAMQCIILIKEVGGVTVGVAARAGREQIMPCNVEHKPENTNNCKDCVRLMAGYA